MKTAKNKWVVAEIRRRAVAGELKGRGPVQKACIEKWGEGFENARWSAYKAAASHRTDQTDGRVVVSSAELTGRGPALYLGPVEFARLQNKGSSPFKMKSCIPATAVAGLFEELRVMKVQVADLQQRLDADSRHARLWELRLVCHGRPRKATPAHEKAR